MQRLWFLLGICLFFCSCTNTVRYEEGKLKYRLGDDKLWSTPTFNDSNWDTLRRNTGTTIFWIREKIEIVKRPKEKLGLHIESFGAFEVYWDGVLIGNNGKLAQKNQPEIAGTETTYLLLPDSLSAIGNHTLALRATQSHYQNLQRSVGVKVEQYERLLTRPLIIMAFMNLMAGAFLIAGIYFLLVYWNSNRKSFPVLVFGIICLLFFALLIVEYLKFYTYIPYSEFFVRLEWVGWLTFAIAILVPFYLALQFGTAYKYWLPVPLTIILFVVYIVNYGHYDVTAISYSFLMWLTSMGIVFEAIFRKQKGAVIVGVGLLSSVVIHHYLVYDFGLFISFSVIMLCMLYLHSLSMSVLEKEHADSLVLSSRLRLELLKKNIQPHFLKNTLTSLIDWVEESPKEGTAFIQALAGEFDIMNDISEKKLIPIGQEIMLCKTHLAVMGFRKEIDYTWQDFGIDEKETLPPAVIHTLLENGITHNIPIENKIRFELHYVVNNGEKEYRFLTFAKPRAKINEIKQGNGFGYVKARLTESYGNKWQLDATARDFGWLTIIKISQK